MVNLEEYLYIVIYILLGITILLTLYTFTYSREKFGVSTDIVNAMYLAIFVSKFFLNFQIIWHFILAMV